MGRGRNIRDIGLIDVLETAKQIEMHLLGASDRIASVVVGALAVVIDDLPEGEAPITEQPA